LLEDLVHLGDTKIILDKQLIHEMSWPSVDDFWEKMTRSGPWYSRRVQFGDAYMEEAKKRFMAIGKYKNDDENFSSAVPLKHRPVARLIVLRRQITPAL
jgi:hypothetical protein